MKTVYNPCWVSFKKYWILAAIVVPFLIVVIIVFVSKSVVFYIEKPIEISNIITKDLIALELSIATWTTRFSIAVSISVITAVAICVSAFYDWKLKIAILCIGSVAGTVGLIIFFGLINEHPSRYSILLSLIESLRVYIVSPQNEMPLKFFERYKNISNMGELGKILWILSLFIQGMVIARFVVLIANSAVPKQGLDILSSSFDKAMYTAAVVFSALVICMTLTTAFPDLIFEKGKNEVKWIAIKEHFAALNFYWSVWFSLVLLTSYFIAYSYLKATISMARGDKRLSDQVLSLEKNLEITSEKNLAKIISILMPIISGQISQLSLTM